MDNPYLENIKLAKKGVFKPISNLDDLKVNDKGRYDANAPKFIYRRNFQTMTRKTSRVTKDTDPKSIRDISIAPSKAQKGKKYPFTKPMIGWERVFVGRGKFIKKGRTKKSPTARNLSIYRPSKKGLKTSKPKFIKWGITYGGFDETKK